MEILQRAIDAFVAHRQYDSFGNVTDESGPAVDFIFGYTGKAWDADAELYDYYHRMYDPVVGRFASADPLGLASGDANLYRYVGNNPLNYIDPTGLCGQSWSGSQSLPSVWDVIQPDYSFMDSYEDPWNPLYALDSTLNDISLNSGSLGDYSNDISSTYIDHFYFDSTINQDPFAEMMAAANSDIHSQMAIGLTKDGTGVYLAGGKLVPAVNPAVPYYEPAGSEYINNALLTALVGDYSGAETNLGGIAGSIAAGFLGIDLPKDLADLTYGFHHWEWSWSHVGNQVLNGIALAPVVGVLKNLKYVDEVADVSKTTSKTISNTLQSVPIKPSAILVSKLAKGMELDPTRAAVFRGGQSFKLKPNDFKIDKTTGLVKTTHGVSLDVGPASLQKFGGATQIKSIPSDLKIIQRGQRLEHFEIVPRTPMSQQKFQQLLDKIEVF